MKAHSVWGPGTHGPFRVGLCFCHAPLRATLALQGGSWEEALA